MAGADGSVEAASERMRQRAARMRDHTVALKVFAAWSTKQTDDGFQFSRNLEGKAFEPLAESTIQGRLRAAGATKSGKAARRKREKMTAPGGIKPLVKTARARNSQRMLAAGHNTLEWSAVGYLEPHITGTSNDRPPERNPTVFERVGSSFQLKAKAGEKLRLVITTYVETGKVNA